jgi:hypothetical protein
MGSDAVLDKETGLVWERSPSNVQRLWFETFQYCYELKLGDRKGWRVPAVHELTSLAMPTTDTFATALAAGQPFNDIFGAHPYWSSTPDVADPQRAWVVHLIGQARAYSSHKNNKILVWCVRGGQGGNHE